MSFYSRYIFPRLCDCLTNRRDINALRTQLLEPVRGRVLEIGIGTGLNLLHYPDGIDQITSVDPNPGMHKLLERRVRASRIKVDRAIIRCEELPFEAESFDVVVSTLTMCSIPELERAMQQLYRVLRPGGTFHFLEHGVSDDPGVRRWQSRLNWIQGRLADGCRLNVPIASAIRKQFETLNYETFCLKGAPRFIATMYMGVACK